MSETQSVFRRKLSKLELLGIALAFVVIAVISINANLEPVRELQRTQHVKEAAEARYASGMGMEVAREEFDIVVENYTVVAAMHMNDYRQELEALGFEQMLESDRLADRSAASANSLQMEQIVELTEGYQMKSLRVFDQVVIDLRALDIDAAKKDALLKGFCLTIDVQSNLLEEWWEAEVERATVIEEVTLMAANGTNWSTWESSIVIPGKSEANAFNEAVEHLDELDARQLELANEIQRHAQRRRDLGCVGIL